MNQIILDGKILRRQWKLLNQIGKGKHSIVYAAQNLITGELVAVKIEESQVFSRLQNEASILFQLQGAKNNFGTPHINWVGVDNLMNDYNFMIFELLGPSLEVLFNICDKKFSPKTVLMIAIQSLQILENLHSQNIVHGDIKPSNFCMGLENNSHSLYMIDYGMSKQYRDSYTGIHINYKEKQSIEGDEKFMSINSHYNIDTSRRDDLQSLAYMLIYFAKGYLPWENLRVQNVSQIYQMACNLKQKIIMEEFCSNLPHIFIIFLNYAKNMGFSESPDYVFLKNLFENYFIEKEYQFDYQYDWIYQHKINNEIILNNKYNLEYQINSDEEQSCQQSIQQNDSTQQMDPRNILQSKNYYENKRSSFSVWKKKTETLKSQESSNSSIEQNSYRLTKSLSNYKEDQLSCQSLDERQDIPQDTIDHNKINLHKQETQNYEKQKDQIEKQQKEKLESLKDESQDNSIQQDVSDEQLIENKSQQKKSQNNKLRIQNDNIKEAKRITKQQLKQHKSLDSKNTQSKQDKSIQKSKSGKEGEDSQSYDNTISNLSFSEDKTIESDFEIQFSDESFKFQLNFFLLQKNLLVFTFNKFFQYHQKIQLNKIFNKLKLTMIRLSLLIQFLITILQTQSQNQCIQGRNPQLLNNKEYLLEFSKGNCSPVIIIPPLTGTRLYVQILDCELFKQENPFIFKTCGWTHCKKKIYEFWKSVPQSEYPVWLSNIGTPMNILSPFDKSSNCLASLMDVPIDFSKDSKDNIIKTKGYKITYGGNTPGTSQNGQCGERACNEIFPDQLQPLIKLQYWQEFLKPMNNYGYKRGLTYQFIPYDFRYSMDNNQLNKLFAENIERIYKITGKKVYLVSLSYGVNNTYYQITKLSKEQKKMVKGFMGMGGNYAGVAMGNFSILAPFNYYGIGMFKLQYKSALYLQSHLPSVYENATQNIFDNFKDHPFMQEIKKRTEYEEGITQTDESIYSEFLPKLEDTCSPQNFEHFGNTCKLGIPSESQPIMKFGEEIYTRENLGKMYKKWGNSADVYKFWKTFQEKEFSKLENPGVPIIALTMRTCSTPIFYDMPVDLKDQIKQQKYVEPNVTFGYGDSIVDTLSLYAGPLKWAYEYKMQTVQDAQPVKIVDVCGLYNMNKSVYDDMTNEGEKVMNKNDFIGIDCNCMKDKNPFKCSHGGMFRDPNVGQFFSKLIISNEVSYTEEYKKFINDFNEEELNQMTVDDCPQVKYDYEN